MSWLPKAEEKMANLPPVAADPRSVRIQIEELKVSIVIIAILNIQWLLKDSIFKFLIAGICYRRQFQYLCLKSSYVGYIQSWKFSVYYIQK